MFLNMYAYLKLTIWHLAYNFTYMGDILYQMHNFMITLLSPIYKKAIIVEKTTFIQKINIDIIIG